MGRQSRLRATRKALQGLIDRECIDTAQAGRQYRKEKGRPSTHKAEQEWQRKNAAVKEWFDGLRSR